MTRPAALLAAALAVASLAACAAGPERERLGLDDPKVGERVDRVCFNRQINGFSEWNEGDGLILRRGIREEVLVTLPVCPAADFAQRVGIDERFSAGCLRPGDRLFVSSSAFGGTRSSDPFETSSCLIGEIYAYDRDAEPDADDADGSDTDEDDEA